MRVFLDTNVVIDLLAGREPFYFAAAKLMMLAEQGKISVYVSPLSFATAYYILSRGGKAKEVLKALQSFSLLAKVLPMDQKCVDQSLLSEFNDFEDSLQYTCALQLPCDCIVSRDLQGFKKSLIPVRSPEEFLVQLG